MQTCLPCHLHMPIVQKFWKPQPPRGLRACSGVCRNSFTFSDHSPLCSLVHSPVISFPLGPYIFLSFLLSIQFNIVFINMLRPYKQPLPFKCSQYNSSCNYYPPRFVLMHPEPSVLLCIKSGIVVTITQLSDQLLFMNGQFEKAVSRSCCTVMMRRLV